MNRILLSIVLMLSALVLSAQNEVDALRYSQLSQTGSARYNSMGGAFGALGGDLSVMASNPAGIGVYRKSDFGFSLSWAWNNVGTDFNGTYSTANSNSCRPSNTGFVISQPSINSSDWKFVNYGFSYNQMADYNNEFLINGINKTSSMLDWEAEKINSDVNPEAAALNSAYVQADAVFYDSASNAYTNDFSINNTYDLNQNHRLYSHGYAGEYDFTMAANYDNVLYLGGTFGIQHISYDQQIYHNEISYSNVTWLESFVSNDYLFSKGNGVNLKFGFIYKINQMIRIGGAFHTPTWYNFRDDFRTDVNATINYPNGKKYNTGNSPNGYYDWELTTPWHILANTAFVFGKHGIFSAEYEYVGYQGMKLKDYYNTFSEENQTINNLYKAGHNIKIGAEYQIGIIRLRGGFVYNGSPFESNTINSDATKLTYSGGAGIATGSFYFDLSYQYATSKEKYFMYNGSGSMADLSTKSNRMISTIGFRF